MAIFYTVVVVLMALVGIALVLFGAYKLFTSQAYAKVALSIGMGFLLVFAGKVTELKFKGVEIKKDAEQASNDADTIRAIKERVERQSATIDAAFYNAQNALTTSEQASNKVEQLNVTLDKANQSLTNLNETLELTSLITKAQGYDRIAFYKLFNQYSSNSIAAEVVNGVVTRVEEQALILKGMGMTPNWTGLGLDPEKLQYEDFVKLYDQELRLNRRSVYIQHVVLSSHYTERQKMDFYADAIAHDNNLIVVQVACQVMDEKAHLNKNFIGGDLFLKWYEEHKAGFKTTL